MGLAASQARFLAITSRKMNCEFQSMEIAQQKLSVTRDLQRAAKEYQNSMDASKLVWETEDSFIYDVSYDTMMTPSNINSYQPHLVTDPRGKIVLSKSMFEAVKAAGIIDDEGNPRSDAKTPDGKKVLYSSAGYKLFLEKIRNSSNISASTINRIQNKYDPKAGVGGALIDEADSNAMTITNFINYLKNAKECTVKTMNADGTEGYPIALSGGSCLNKGEAAPRTFNYYEIQAGSAVPEKVVSLNIPEGSKLKANCTSTTGTPYTAGFEVPAGGITVTLEAGDIAPITFGLETSKKPGQDAGNGLYSLKDLSGLGGTYSSKSAFTQIASGEIMIASGGNVISEQAAKDLTLGDILSGNVVFAYNGDDPHGTVNNLINKIAELLGYSSDGLATNKGLNTDSEAARALKLALQFTTVKFGADPSATGGGRVPGTDVSSADPNNKIVDISNQNSNPDKTYIVSMTNITKTFLTYFAMALDGFESEFKVADLKANSRYATDDLNYWYVVAAGSGGDEPLDVQNANFYNQLYNNICMYGACTDTTLQEQVTDSKWLSNALKNGQLFISSLNSDGYFYQGHYTLNGHVGEVPDEDAIARAELEYEMTKNQLNYKEETLELKMKNLDTEISALSTEFDTVKNLISKNVEKVFTMFST